MKKSKKENAEKMSNVSYIHVRDERIINDKNSGGSKISKVPVATFAFFPLEDSTVAIGLSVCSPKENFNYRDGRVKSAGKAISKRFVFDADFFNMHYLSELVTEYIGDKNRWIDVKVVMEKIFSQFNKGGLQDRINKLIGRLIKKDAVAINN